MGKSLCSYYHNHCFFVSFPESQVDLTQIMIAQALPCIIMNFTLSVDTSNLLTSTNQVRSYLVLPTWLLLVIRGFSEYLSQMAKQPLERWWSGSAFCLYKYLWRLVFPHHWANCWCLSLWHLQKWDLPKCKMKIQEPPLNGEDKVAKFLAYCSVLEVTTITR